MMLSSQYRVGTWKLTHHCIGLLDWRPKCIITDYRGMCVSKRSARVASGLRRNLPKSSVQIRERWEGGKVGSARRGTYLFEGYVSSSARHQSSWALQIPRIPIHDSPILHAWEQSDALLSVSRANSDDCVICSRCCSKYPRGLGLGERTQRQGRQKANGREEGPGSIGRRHTI